MMFREIPECSGFVATLEGHGVFSSVGKLTVLFFEAEWDSAYYVWDFQAVVC